MTLSTDTVRRLALVRLSLGRADEESRLAAPYSFDSINRLHDATETFLALAVQHHHVEIPKTFNGYWAALQGPLGRPLGYQAQMQRFNKVRVALKHFGVEPAPREIASCRDAVLGLLHDETPALFDGQILQDVSLSAFVTSQKAKDHLDQAETAQAADLTTDAFGHLAEAFEEVIDDYQNRKLIASRRSVFSDLRDMTFMKPSHRRVSGKQADFENAVIEGLTSLNRTTTIVGLGVDLRRYGRFAWLVPGIQRFMDGRTEYRDRDGIVRTALDFDFALGFVVTTALHLAEFDYDFDYLELQRLRRAALENAEAPPHPASGAAP